GFLLREPAYFLVDRLDDVRFGHSRHKTLVTQVFARGALQTRESARDPSKQPIQADVESLCRITKILGGYKAIARSQLEAGNPAPERWSEGLQAALPLDIDPFIGDPHPPRSHASAHPHLSRIDPHDHRRSRVELEVALELRADLVLAVGDVAAES